MTLVVKLLSFLERAKKLGTISFSAEMLEYRHEDPFSTEEVLATNTLLGFGEQDIIRAL